MLKKECLFYHKINQINELSRKKDDENVYKLEEDEIKVLSHGRVENMKKNVTIYIST